ncbi:MAG: DUF3368 domain-containing protein [Chloroflexaceae bacterium]|nr:DUF3368 domain-containing protein [Chloroflexaceae bacterium]
MPYRILAPDVVIVELNEPSGVTLQGYGLQVLELPGEQVREVERMRVHYPKPGINDLFALVLAKATTGLLLTGDRHLREVAENEGVKVHGTLWVLDQLVEHQTISPSVAVPALQAMLDHGSRLPRDECQKRLASWNVD